MNPFPATPCASREGFTLVEMLTVVLLIGILTGVGTAFYAGLTRETHQRTELESLRSFLAACRQRASLRGMPVRLQLIGNDLSPVDSPGMTCRLGPTVSGDTRLALSQLSFTASSAWLAGKPTASLTIALTSPGGSVDGSPMGEHRVSMNLLEP